jgi:transforming growth factor-beta-induced protein
LKHETNGPALLAAQPALVKILSTAQNITLVAPSNAAFDKFLATPNGKAVAADSTAVAALLSYHVFGATVPASGFTSTAQFLPSLLTDPKYTNVTGGQVVEGIVIDKKVELFSGLKEKSTVQTAVCPLFLTYFRPPHSLFPEWNGWTLD